MFDRAGLRRLRALDPRTRRTWTVLGGMAGLVGLFLTCVCLAVFGITMVGSPVAPFPTQAALSAATASGERLIVSPAVPKTGGVNSSEQLGRVVNVVDGDTINVIVDGSVYLVRYIGVDTPELGEPCAEDARAFNASLVSGQEVQLVKDASDVDRYGRLLRYVYAGERFVNFELVAQGYAEAVAYPPDTAHAEEFEGLEAQARAANLACHAAGVFGGAIGESVTSVPTSPPPAAATNPPAPTSPAPAPTSPPPAPTQPTPNCDPSYPTVCIPPPPPDLNCSEIPHRNFPVLAPDPHNFDGNKDGIGCEGE